jgi:hypothetical protein
MVLIERKHARSIIVNAPRAKEPGVLARPRSGSIEVVSAASYKDSNDHTTQNPVEPIVFAEPSSPQNQTFQLCKGDEGLLPRTDDQVSASPFH